MRPFQVTYWSASAPDGTNSTKTAKVSRFCFERPPFAPDGRFADGSTLHLQYLVEPRAEWDSLRVLRSVIINDILYRRKDFVYVRGLDGTNPHALWVARLRDIRARDSSCAYARVLWMYHPKDIPEQVVCQGEPLVKGGRQPYHGSFELIASNHMDIISLACIIGKATVRKWVERKNQTHRAWYWRQALNIAARLVCVCSQPENPDRLMIKCPAVQTGCGKWLHQDCVAAHQASLVLSRSCGPGKAGELEVSGLHGDGIVCPACNEKI